MSTSRLPQEEHPLDNLESRKSAKDEFYRFQLRQAKLRCLLEDLHPLHGGECGRQVAGA